MEEAGGTVPETPPVRLRVTYALVQASWVLIINTICQLTGKAQNLFLHQELTQLPLATEVTLMGVDALQVLGNWLLIALVLLAGILGLLSWRGVLDRRLRMLIAVNLIFMSVVLPFWALSIGWALRSAE